MERLTRDIYIGGVTTKATVKQKKIKYVVNLVGLPLSYKNDKFPIRDGNTGNDLIMFLRIIQAIDKHIKRNRTPILINCALGMSRSPVICALYLYYSGRSPKYTNFDDTLNFVMSKSKVASPNDELIQFTKKRAIPFIDSLGTKNRRYRAS